MSDDPSFIVVFNDGVTAEQVKAYAEELKANGGKVTNEYYSVLKGFAANIPESFLTNLRGNKLIKSVEPNSVVSIQ